MASACVCSAERLHVDRHYESNHCESQHGWRHGLQKRRSTDTARKPCAVRARGSSGAVGSPQQQTRFWYQNGAGKSCVTNPPLLFFQRPALPSSRARHGLQNLKNLDGKSTWSIHKRTHTRAHPPTHICTRARTRAHTHTHTHTHRIMGSLSTSNQPQELTF